MFQSRKIQPSGCSPTGISLEETLLEAGPSHGCLFLCCTGTLLAQMLEGYGEKNQENQTSAGYLVSWKLTIFPWQGCFSSRSVPQFRCSCGCMNCCAGTEERAVWGSLGPAAGMGRPVRDCCCSRHLMRQNTVSPPFLTVNELHLLLDIK